MVLLQKVNASMFGQIYPLLQELDPQLDRRIWQSIFQYPWAATEDYCGYGLFDGETIVGFLGLIFSQRQINGNLERFCNVTSWIVKESYRGHSMSLMFPLMKLKDYTLTDLSAYAELFPILKRFGFQCLDSKIKLLLPIPFVYDRPSISAVRILQDPEAIRTNLEERDRTAFEDHQGIVDCYHLLLTVGNRHCYVVYTYNRQGRLPYCYLQSLSDRQLFADHSLLCRRYIAQRHRTPYVLIDSRFGNALPWTFDLPLPFTKLYRSERLTPLQIDNLYTEFMVLNFNLLPTDLQTFVKEFWHRTDTYYAS